VVEIPQVNPHPGMEHYLNAYKKAITPRTKVLTFTHLSSSVGDLFPAKELCALAREHGVMSLVDGAQSFGLLDVNLTDMSPDFYTGSAHKWPCGARECGVLYINARVHKNIWPSIYSAYPGAVGISRTFESFGQRDEATMIAFREALEFQTRVGRAAIEKRSRELANQLIAGLSKLPDVKVWTSPNPALNAAVVSFLPGSLNSQKLGQALYEKDRIGTAGRGGGDRGGLRASPHFYNTPEEVDRLVSAVSRYLKTGV
ncbi:MAG TPA: aminotransferase class V-fold PLP-dependent enzyme, partial [Vicinamibacterales bacterium]|nr:aminotransferase class V-fold PLP-dependent enzyme [Vicinamibacterales bacterium]